MPSRKTTASCTSTVSRISTATSGSSSTWSPTQHCEASNLRGFQPLWNFFEDLLKDRIGGDVLGLRFEVRQDTVPERGNCGTANVIVADVELPVDEGSHFRRQDDRLRAARAGADANVLVGDRRRIFAARMRG